MDPEGQDSMILWVEDYGEGIKDSDIRRLFEKGCTWSNYHNGRYKSTGMGLYMVSKIADRLGHKICVESEYGKGSRFGRGVPLLLKSRYFSVPPVWCIIPSLTVYKTEKRCIALIL